jgi:hypothetical protein
MAATHHVFIIRLATFGKTYQYDLLSSYSHDADNILSCDEFNQVPIFSQYISVAFFLLTPTDRTYHRPSQFLRGCLY